MKKIIALLLVAVMAIGFCACAAKTETPAEPAATEETTTTEPAATEETTEEPAAEETETTENQHFDKLTLEFVPSKDADVILTATRNGLSNDSTNPADWNGEANATKKDGPQVTYYRSLIYATPSEYGKELAAKVNAGEKLTWEDLDKATWAVQKTSSSAGYIYPSMWLMANYDGKKISDLSNVMPIDSGYGTAFSYAAAESVDIIVCYADGRNDYEASWMLPTDQQDETGKQGMGRSDSIWNEMNVIGVTEGIYNDTVAISKESQYYTPEIVAALQDCFINIIGTDEGKAIFDVYSHTGYAKATDADYDGARAALQAVAE